MPEAAASSDVGSWFGKYWLLKKLAAGGMGEVFLARQQGPAGFQKLLVVKKILAHLTESKEFVEAFLGEARLAAQMNHRNIVQVFELGEQDGAYFIAMEYVHGKSLRDLIDACARRDETIPAELCRSVMEQICDGASYAHNLTDVSGRPLNLVHRDLNPQNVLISYGGDVKIIDFGIAKSELSTVKTEAGMIKGKFVYMSPEQSLARSLDKRSDIFAIGISLYEMLTGINPFHKNNIVLTLEAVQRYEPPPPSASDPGSAPFDRIVARALAKDRDRRYADASQMQEDLRRLSLPRPAERLGQFMTRIFRAELEQEQQQRVDSDKGMPRVTPPRATPSRPSSPTATTVPDPVPEAGATMLLTNARSAKAQPSAAKPPPPPPKPARSPDPDGSGDTLIDSDRAPAPRPAASDDAPGGTMMLDPGQLAGARKPSRPAAPSAVTEEVTAPEGPSGTQILGASGVAAAKAAETPGGTQILGTSPVPAKKAAQQQGATRMLTPEEADEAQRVAQAKMEQAAKALVRTRTREDKEAELRQARVSRSLWIALGVGTLAAVALIVGLLFLFFADESGTSASRRPRRAETPATQASPVPDPGDRSR